MLRIFCANKFTISNSVDCISDNIQVTKGHILSSGAVHGWEAACWLTLLIGKLGKSLE
jgi:hypothetical protein